MATIEAFAKNPEYVHDFYNEMKPELLAAKPNAAHLALAELEQKYSGNVSIVTQNVDTLHEKARNSYVAGIHFEK